MYKRQDLNHAVKRDPKTNLRSEDNNWDFWTLLPEALHQVTITMSSRGIPYSYRHMHGFGSHTYSFINNKNERIWAVSYTHLLDRGADAETTGSGDDRLRYHHGGSGYLVYALADNLYTRRG